MADGLKPAYPLGLHKNFAGPILARCAALLLIAPEVVDLPPRARHVSLVLFVAGLAAVQSRNAAIVLTVATVVWVVRSRGVSRGQRIGGIFLVAMLATFAGYTLVTEFKASQTIPGDSLVHNSYTIRTDVEAQTQDLWRTSPWLGVGLRFFNTSRYEGYQAPNNVFDEVLAEGGLFGATGMVILITGSCMSLSKAKGNLSIAGFTLVATAFIFGQFDIFWVNGVSFPWIIAGAGAAVRSTRS